MKKAICRRIRNVERKFYGYMEEALTFNDPEDIHKMRVSGRTLLTFFDTIADRKESKRPGFIKMRRSLKKSMGILGELRDMDVLIDEMELRLSDAPPAEKRLLTEWVDHVKEKRDGSREKLSKKLPSWIDHKWEKRVEHWAAGSAVDQMSKEGLEEKMLKLRRNKDKAVACIRDHVKQGIDLSDKDVLEDLHQGRITVKRLRYALANFGELMGADYGNEIDRLKDLQEHLGHVQDLRTWIDMLCGFSESKGKNAVRIAGKIADSWRKEMLETLNGTDLSA